MNCVRVSLNALSSPMCQYPQFSTKSHVPYLSESAMINDILLNIVFFAEFPLNVNFLCVSVIEVIFLTGNFNQKFSSTCCAFRMNDDFCLPKSF